MPASSIISSRGGAVAAAAGRSSGSGNGQNNKNVGVLGHQPSATSSTTGGAAAAAAFPWSSSSLPPVNDDNNSNANSNGNSNSNSNLALEGRTFAVNEECTSLRFSPSGRLVCAGFADGTVRLFDLTGTYSSSSSTNTGSTNSGSNSSSHSHNSGDANNSADSSASENEAFFANNHTSNNSSCGGRRRVRRPSVHVSSREHQRYGAVAGQIRARGVHTALRMDVDVSPDCQYCFAGCLRGSMEMVAVHLGALEESFAANKDGNNTAKKKHDDDGDRKKGNLLDWVTVHRHSDAKLRGFGACARLRSSSGSGETRYLLLTGKAIKNIHIWSFTPPPPPPPPPQSSGSSSSSSSSAAAEAVWECLYDTATNGNTIKLLAFRYSTSSSQLQALSKSDNQKLRVWDLQHEEEEQEKAHKRPSRPQYYDVANTESLLGIAGDFGVCGGDEFFNQMSIVRLDDHVNDLYNHTEIALFGDSATTAENAANSNATTADVRPPSQSRRSRRPQRGDLKCVVSVAGGTAGHALLELSDGSVSHYCQQPQAPPSSSSSNNNLATATATTNNNNNSNASPLRTVLPPLPEGHCRHVAVGRVGRQGLVCAAAAGYNPATGMGSIRLHVLEKERSHNTGTTPLFWGFLPSQSGSGSVTVEEGAAAATAKDAAGMGHLMKYTDTASVTAATTSMKSSNGNNKDRPIPSSTTAATFVSSSASRKTGGTADSAASTATEKAKARLAKIVTASKKQFVAGAENSINKTASKRGGGGDQSLVTPRTASTTTSTTASNSTGGSSSNTLSSAPSSSKTLLARRLSTPFINAATVDDGEGKPRVSVDSSAKNQRKESKNAAVVVATAQATTTTNSTIVPDSRKRKKERNSGFPMSSLEVEQQSKKRQPTSTASKQSLPALRESMQSPFPMASNDNDDGSVFTLSSPSTFRTPRSPMPSSSARRDPAATRELILEVCREKLALVESLLQEHGSAPSVWERRAALSKLQQEQDSSGSSSSSSSSSPAAVARYRLSLEHREAHRRVRQQILGTVQSTIRSIQEAPSYPSLEKARGFLQAALDAYQQQVEAMVHRQWNETATLVATTATTTTSTSTHNKDGSGAEPQMVPFAFPSVFAQARQCFPEIVYSLQ